MRAPPDDSRAAQPVKVTASDWQYKRADAQVVGQADPLPTRRPRGQAAHSLYALAGSARRPNAERTPRYSTSRHGPLAYILM